jgi:hypothetical protein
VAIGLVLGVVISVAFYLPSLFGNTIFEDASDYTRITVFAGNTQWHDVGEYRYIFYFKYGSYTTTENPIAVSVRGINEIVPSVAGSKHTILDLDIIVDEIHDNYVALLVKQSE